MVDKTQLFEFVNRAGKATYAGGGTPEAHPEREDFFELTYDKEMPWYYKDSYTGHSRSGGQEIVRFQGKPIWWSGYGGGMVKGKESLSHEAFTFLKKALFQDEKKFESLRGPHEFSEGEWSYSYTQEGDIFDFYGYEEISYKGEKVFWHRVVGGILNHE